jgi:epoxyqueuosine reductase
MRCIEACPTAAITQPGELDPRRCISYLTIEHRGPIEPSLADRIGTRVAGCDACQEVCPYNATTARPHRVRPNAWLERQESVRATELSDLVNLRSGRYRAFVRDSALRRIPRRQLRRNALLALGNRAGPLSTDERQAVQQAVTSDDEQIESAARRVLDRRK